MSFEVEQPMVITHTAPLYNLPCHSPRCLEAMLYLEMWDSKLKYERKICAYNINPFSPSLTLPIVRYKNRSIIGGSTNSTIDTFEGIGNDKGILNNGGLNSQLSPSQKADLSALSTLIRDKLNLVTLHQTYMDQENWNEYSNLMSQYLPYLPRNWLLNTERKSVIEKLQRHQIISKKQAINLLQECLNIIYVKMEGINNLIHNNIKKNKNENEYFFGDKISSIDAVLVSELAMLACVKGFLPNRYLDELKDDRKLDYLLEYMSRILNKYRKNIDNKLDKDQYISPPILQPKNFKKGDGLFADNVSKSQRSLLFVLGSFTALALYWKWYKPIRVETA